jgi:hypothetical protein
LPTVAELAQQELSRRYSLQGRTQVAPRVQTMQNARPTVRSALSNLMRDAVDATGLEGGYRQGLLNAAGGVETAVDFLPVVGDVLGLEDASRAYGQGDMVGAGINMMGVVPIIGDAGVKLSKGARSALRDQGFTEGFFHASKQDIQDGFKAGYSDGMVFVTPEREFANNWVGKGKYQQRLGEDNIDDMRRADRQKLWDEYESQYGSYENWPSEIEDEYHKRSVNLAQQYQASGGAIYPVAVKANKQFDPEENPEVIAEFLKSQGRDPNATTIVSGKTDLEAYQEGNYLFYENKEMADFLKDKGYDSVWLREDTTQSGLGKPFSTLAVLDETGVKPVYDFAREADTAASALRSLDINAEVANAKAAYDANPNNEELRRSYMALRRERDAMPAEEVTSPLSGSGTDAMMPRDIYDMDEDEYIKAINPQGSRIAPEARPNLGMGDMYGMAPRNAEEVMTQELPSGEIIRYVQDGDSVYALGYNPDLGEEDVIGYMVGGGDGSELAVVDQMQGQGIGGNLSYLYRSQNPMAQSGGFTEAGEGAARKTYRRIMGYE